MNLIRLLIILAATVMLTWADDSADDSAGDPEEPIYDRHMCYSTGTLWENNTMSGGEIINWWCANGARGDYKPGQSRWHCHDLEYRNQSVQFWTQRTINGAGLLSFSRCNAMLANTMYRCAYGGEGMGGGWFYR